MAIRVNIVITLVLVLCLVAPAIPVDGGTTSYDYSYMAKQDFTMDNEYNNITGFNSTKFEYINISTSNNNIDLVHVGTNSFTPLGRFMRTENDIFWKYVIGNDNNIKFMNTRNLIDFNFTDVKNTTYQFDTTHFYYMSNFYKDGIFYLLNFNWSSYKLNIHWSNNPTNLTDHKELINGSSSQWFIPLNMYFINDTYYLITNLYNGSNDNNTISIFWSDDLFNITKNQFTFSYPDVPLNVSWLQKAAADGWYFDFDLYHHNNTYYAVVGETKSNTQEYKTYKLGVDITDVLNISRYTYYHSHFGHKWLYIEYLPIGSSIIQYCLDSQFDDYYLLHYQTDFSILYYDITTIYKFYKYHLLEYSNVSIDKSVSFSNYLSFSPYNNRIYYNVSTSNNFTMYKLNGEILDLDMFYLKIDELEYNEESYGAEIMKFKIYYPYIINTNMILPLYLNYIEYGYYNEQWAELLNKFNDYDLFSQSSVGGMLYKKAILSIKNDKTNISCNVNILLNPSNPLLWFFGKMTWQEQLGLIVFIVGLIIVMLGAIAKKQPAITWGLILTVSGLGLIGGSGLFSVLF